MKSKRPVTEKGKRAVSDFERKYNSELEADESPLGDSGRVTNTYGDKWKGPASSAAPQYRDPSKAQEAVKTFRRSYRRDSD